MIPGAERFTGEAGAGAARGERGLVLAGVADEGVHVVFVARHDDAERLDLEQRGVGAVEGARDVVEEEFPFDDPFQVVANAFT